MILKVVSSNLTIRQYIYKKMMNYKDKKYLSEDRWLAENLDSFNFFFVAQLKACDSANWTHLQSDLSRLNLKTRSITFKNIKNLSFFSSLSKKMKETIFQGNIILIYSNKECIFSSQIVNSVKSMSILRPFILYSCGRMLNPNSSVAIKSLEVKSSSEWGSFLDQMSGSEIPNTLALFQSSLCNGIKSQHETLLNVLEYKINDENKL